MIIDDDPIISFLHKRMLQKNNIEQDPLTFLNGKEAWDFLVRDTLDRDYLILLDLNMPVMNGWGFLDKLEQNKDIAKRTKVVIITSSINPVDKNKADKYYVVKHFFSKPLAEFSEIKKVRDLVAKTIS